MLVVSQVIRNHLIDRRIAFLSDRGKGLKEVIPDIFPNDHHGYYFQHIMQNFNDQYAGKYAAPFKKLFRKILQCIAYAVTEQEYQDAMMAMELNSADAKEWVLRNDVDHWSHAPFPGQSSQAFERIEASASFGENALERTEGPYLVPEVSCSLSTTFLLPVPAFLGFLSLSLSLSPAMAMEAVPAVNRVQSAFEELESQKTLIDNCTRLWSNLSDHFASLERSIAERAEALESRLTDLDSKTAESLEVLSGREESIPSLESAAAALVEQRRDAAISEMESPPAPPAAGTPFDVPGALRGYCRRMDSIGLWRFMVSRRKDLGVLRREISDAVAESVDPVRLVLDAVGDFVENQENGGLADRCWACGLLLRSLFDAEGRKGPEVSSSIREKAGEVAEAWKKKVDERGESGGMGGAEAQMFLHLLVAFGVHSKIEDEFRRKLVLEFASRKEVPKLAAKLGLGEKLGDTIDELIKNGKEIEAVYLAHESGLTDKFSPVSLLKSYLQSSKKNASTILKNGNHSLSAMEESTTVELNAIRSIIKCVEALNLEKEFTLDNLRKRMSSLEKAKADRKKAAAAKSQNKRARVGGQTGFFRPTKAARTPNVSYPTSRRQPPPAHQMPAARHPFNLPSQGAYKGPSSAPYGGPYSRSPSVPQSYFVPDEMAGHGSSMQYGAPPVNYSGYDYSGGPAAPAQQSYTHQM
ncbi:hypothetical protein Taro_020074 [Colocasia esculenta]|uniref:FRIGIDA-like protein n=1 Tax=Colocasia esculenta TaxID=4460 RepID=A0A843UVI6_COLES|nr:hypothetical protein [Colocasia esculenta]